jgi:lipopolysaccharide/colanic/teichoic acid biosynthesis glycosyltransferase
VQRAIKWLFDRLVALLLLLGMSPILLVIALVLRASTGAPVLYRQTRLGLHGRPFTLLKFRSLTTEAGASIAAEDDARITKPGAHLRRWRLDELPGLINVLTGSMSLVGPRPLTREHASTLHPGERAALLSVRPGVTGVSALAFLGDDAALSHRENAEALYLERILPAKVELELRYLDSWNLWRDLSVLARTLLQLWSRAARRQSRENVTRLLEEQP